jgi:hypothetical protein
MTLFIITAVVSALIGFIAGVKNANSSKLAALISFEKKVEAKIKKKK